MRRHSVLYGMSQILSHCDKIYVIKTVSCPCSSRLLKLFLEFTGVLKNKGSANFVKFTEKHLR